MPERLLHVLREFSTTIINPFDADEALNGLIAHTMSALDAAGAGLMLVDDDGHLGFAAASGDAVAQMEQVQVESATGVCHYAFTTDRTVVAADIEQLGQWPDYAKRALELGFASVIGVPMRAWGQTIGVLNVYRTRPGDWTEDDVEVCEILAAMGASYILSASRMQSQQAFSDSLRAALESRGVIERAKGIIMARGNFDADTAFSVLRKTSQDRNVKLRDVAQELVDQATGTARTRSLEVSPRGQSPRSFSTVLPPGRAGGS